MKRIPWLNDSAPPANRIYHKTPEKARRIPGFRFFGFMKSRKIQLFSVIVKLFVIVKQYRIFADYHGFAFLVFMVSFVLEMASAIDLYLLKYSTMTENEGA